jgi:hypothetical protein
MSVKKNTCFDFCPNLIQKIETIQIITIRSIVTLCVNKI